MLNREFIYKTKEQLVKGDGRNCANQLEEANETN